MSILFFYVDQIFFFFSVGLFLCFKDQGNTLASRYKMSTPEVFEAAKPEEVNNGSRIQENKQNFPWKHPQCTLTVEG